MSNQPPIKKGIAVFRVVVLGSVLASLLAASSTYLALKIGILPSASIPAALLAMTLLRFSFGTILEANLVQTAASAGEAVAGGIVFTIPALIILGYWHHFPYAANAAIACLGGLLGILFSIPLRPILINAPQLNFPEAYAIAKVLQLSQKQNFSVRPLLWGVTLGGGIEFAQMGLKIIAVSVEKWIVWGESRTIGFGMGFSPALIGVGYLMGWSVGLSLLLGAFIAWGVSLPLLSYYVPISKAFTLSERLNVYSNDMHYIGLGALLTAALWTLATLLKPFYFSLRLSFQGLFQPSTRFLPPIEQDIPTKYLLIGLVFISLSLYYLFEQIFPIQDILFTSSQWLLLGIILYVLVMGFILAMLCGYFSGLVGVTASPGSAIVMAGLLIMALILRSVLFLKGCELMDSPRFNAAIITIIISAVVAGAASISNDNIQDLKVGHLIGASPWQQQLMLMLGVVIASLVVPYVMQLLFDVYGLTTILPHAHTDPRHTLSAPPAAMVAGLTQAVFNQGLPWDLLGTGVAIMLLAILINRWKKSTVSFLGLGMGIYLPLSSSTPLFIGSLCAFGIQCFLKKKRQKDSAFPLDCNQSKTILLSCGLVSGAALMDVVLAIPFSITGNPNLFSILGGGHHLVLRTSLSFLGLLMLGMCYYRTVKLKNPHV